MREMSITYLVTIPCETIINQTGKSEFEKAIPVKNLQYGSQATYSSMGTTGDPMTYHNKLVRDKIPEIIRSKGKVCKTRKLDGDNFLLELEKKLEEEVKEFLDDPSSEELADILEVVDSLSLVMGSSFDDVLRIKEEKKEARGGFSDRIFLEYVTEFKQGET